MKRFLLAAAAVTASLAVPAQAADLARPAPPVYAPPPPIIAVFTWTGCYVGGNGGGLWSNKTFTNTHHIKPWKPDGRTDLDNLALLCLHHHHIVHSGGWTMSGDANTELTFVGPTGRVMVSRPSPLWTAVTGRRLPS